MALSGPAAAPPSTREREQQLQFQLRNVHKFPRTRGRPPRPLTRDGQKITSLARDLARGKMRSPRPGPAGCHLTTLRSLHCTRARRGLWSQQQESSLEACDAWIGTAVSTLCALLVEGGMAPHDGGAPCWAGADDPPEAAYKSSDTVHRVACLSRLSYI